MCLTDKSGVMTKNNYVLWYYYYPFNCNICFLEMKLKVIQSLTVATNSCVISKNFTNVLCANIKRNPCIFICTIG